MNEYLLVCKFERDEHDVAHMDIEVFLKQIYTLKYLN